MLDIRQYMWKVEDNAQGLAQWHRHLLFRQETVSLRDLDATAVRDAQKHNKKCIPSPLHYNQVY